MIARGVLIASVFLLAGLAVGTTTAHYVPTSGDRFAYDETLVLTGGYGDYQGYTESTVINGSLGVTAVATNQTETAYYYNLDHYQNSSGGNEVWHSSGAFTFSAQSFLYLRGTDNQTGYTMPSVWFYMDNSLPVGSTFTLLNTMMTVVSTSFDYALDTSAGNSVAAIFAEGNGSYTRDDSYGVFNAVYNWKEYFDPGTGYVLGYLYSENDSNNSHDGFTLTDALKVTQTSYPLTPGTSPSSGSSSGGSSGDWLLIAIVAVVVVVVVVGIVVYALTRRRPNLPRHSTTGQVRYAPPPMGPPPPGIRLSPTDQPAVQQIIIKETVKVNCRYCGALIDSTVEKCPVCGAPRT